MASWVEIERVRKDAEEARGIARGLLHYQIEPGALSDWEIDFLQNTVERVEELTTRWSEKLLQVRDDVHRVQVVQGFSVRLLVCRCYEARLDLDEEDEAWIARVYDSDPTSVRRKHIGRLLRCARQLGLIEDRAYG